MLEQLHVSAIIPHLTTPDKTSVFSSWSVWGSLISVLAYISPVTDFVENSSCAYFCISRGSLSEQNYRKGICWNGLQAVVQLVPTIAVYQERAKHPAVVQSVRMNASAGFQYMPRSGL